jgi:hypothetical protein
MTPLRSENYIAACFFGFDFAVFGGVTGSGPRSIEVSRPPANV